MEREDERDGDDEEQPEECGETKKGGEVDRFLLFAKESNISVSKRKTEQKKEHSLESNDFPPVYVILLPLVTSQSAEEDDDDGYDEREDVDLLDIVDPRRAVQGWL